MPKIIKDIENKIFSEATDIFSQKGYIETDMKAIAKSCDIAVGTLYNYYPNKKSLYMAVFLKSWDETLEKLKNISKKESDNELALKGFLQIFYEDTIARNGLGKDVRELCKKGDNDFDIAIKILFENLIKTTMGRFKLKEEYKEIKDIYFRILTIWFSVKVNINDQVKEEERESEDLKFLYLTIKNYFEF